ncbi:DUF3280 domain-containing protein [Notoacmeibacter sp. MSK16QG-6]|uniref:DUF3280 domain-containing protein n=1 Tax=Notoacmeibacter sp. MSK16QG-6 TaxID=2957982 RepID=UPI0020A0538C|nr:DUF3280 domain-containing protein [Notoacmeibacter sp. MSK16QG-6]MCP1200654.1 DUF3280 domain-containing protein [Notoacmeibacter sp. MSK16QG-6]
MRQIVLVLLLSLWAATAYAAPAAPLMPGAKVAFLGITFVDLSTEGAYNGAREDETARTALLAQSVRERFAEEGFVLLSNDPVATDLDRIANPANCYGCEQRIAAKLDADYVVVGEVRKISNLILSMSLTMRDVHTAETVRWLAVDIRSNTDATWLRGMNYILKNQFFPS